MRKLWNNDPRLKVEAKGVSIFCGPTVDQMHDVTPGARSYMHDILWGNNLYGPLDEKAIPRLLKHGRDAGGEVQMKFQAIVRAIRKHRQIWLNYGLT